MSTPSYDLDAHFEAYKRDGYTVLEGLFSQEWVKTVRGRFHDYQRARRIVEGNKPSWWLGSMVEVDPVTMLEAVANPTLLDLLERVIGPFVQLDNLTYAAFPSVTPEEAAGRASGWHRDIWAYMPQDGVYQRPLAMNAITYLQELTDAYGPLRVIPGSHMRQMGITDEQRGKPHPDEIIVHAKPGDVVVTHAALLHSGTPNCSGDQRHFFSIYYNFAGLKCRDNHNGPNVQAIIADANKRGDRRMARLFGGDPLVMARANSGYQEADEVRWARWIAEDRAALAAATAAAAGPAPAKG